MHRALAYTLIWICVSALAPLNAGPDPALSARWFFDTCPEAGRTRWPTHIYFDASWEIITDLKNNRLIYRARGSAGPWLTAGIPLKQPHSVERQPDGRFIIADTDHDRIVVFDDLTGAGIVEQDTLAGHPMLRPHDTVISPPDRLVYMIDSHRRLCRLAAPGQHEEAWQFTEDVIGYARSLSFFDGAMHLINSADGEVIRIDDFDARRFTRFPSHGKTKRAPAGAFTATGLVLNDVEQWQGWYYGTNYFTRSYAEGADPDVFRFIRWRTWDDFAAGRWEDLSELIPPGLVPYYLTAQPDALYVAVFDHEQDSGRDGVLAITDTIAPALP
jgi:hypothetical protein